MPICEDLNTTYIDTFYHIESIFLNIIACSMVIILSLTIINQSVSSVEATGNISNVDLSINEKTPKIYEQYYACTDYDDLTHCDRSSSEVRTHEVKASWSELYRSLGTPTYVEGKYGKALSLLSKAIESVEINNTQSLNPKEFSVSFWIKPLPMPEPFGSIVSHSNIENTAGWSFKMTNNTLVSFEIYDSEGKTTVVDDKYPLPSAKFTNIVGTFDGTKIKLYIDGRLVSEKDFTGVYVEDPLSPLRIGGEASSMGTLLWTGIIDDLTFYDRSIQNDEIEALYSSDNSYPSSNKNQMGLVSHWSFDNDLADSSSAMPFHNDGILRTLIASMAFSPDGRLFFTEKDTGNIRVMVDDKVLDKPFASIKDHHVSYEQGLLGLAVDPSFEKNHFVYVYYTAKDDNKVINKLLRLTEVNNTAVDNTTLLDDIPALDGYHSGGALSFGPDGKLYIGVGDATQPVFAQNPSISIGKVLRINKDGTIPSDNPYPNSPVYTIGHRNVFGIAFDNKTGIGIIAENGDDLYDEINIIEKGGNYGFPTFQPPNVSPETADPKSSILPVVTYWRTPGPTQTIFYHGNQFSELKDSFLMGSVDGDIYSLNFSKIDQKKIEEYKINPHIYPFSAITSVAESPKGDIYFGSFSIYKLNGIDFSNSEQTTHSVKFDFSNNYTLIRDVKVIRQDPNAIQVDFRASSQSTGQQQSGFLDLSIEIPKELLKGINDVVNSNDTKDNYSQDTTAKEIEFTIEDLPSSPNTIVNIRYLPSTDYSLSILGESASEEYVRQDPQPQNPAIVEGGPI